jgi:glycosyltransferase involved in cell wall biosynthesis
MTAIGVVHPDLNAKGGAEAVAMNCLEALQEQYDLTIVTLREPNIEALNEYYNTTIDPGAVTIEREGPIAPKLKTLIGTKYSMLQNALLGRYARDLDGHFDLLVSMMNELGLPAGSIEYAHFPWDWWVNLNNRDQIFHPAVEDDSLYQQLCTAIANVSPATVHENTVFANSEWTAECFKHAYGKQPEILYPPIDTSEFTDRPWHRRENGFVTLGRIDRSKRTKKLVRIIDGVRQRGHDVHLHILGPAFDQDYYAELDSMAAERPYIKLEGELPRSELVDCISSHRYGIHGKEYEHFGMAVAEMVAGGAIPFVPSAGGQRAIVDNDQRLLYNATGEAIEKIDRVLSNPSLQRELRMNSDRIESRFGRERFHNRIRDAVEHALGEPAVKPKLTH